MATLDDHNHEIHGNIANWNRKPLLRKIYRQFHESISDHLADGSSGEVVELGSGVADITEVIPHCIRTDVFPNPWIDQVENAYNLSFGEESVSSLILFDVFHHLRYPGAALKEFQRVLISGGRVILFEPCISTIGWIVYGAMHREPVAFYKPIAWEPPESWNPTDIDYYAAQGNATRVFLRQEVDLGALGWQVITAKRLCSISYVLSGGYSGPQMYPTCALPLMQKIDKLLGCMPAMFATRLLAVLEKVDDGSPIFLARDDSQPSNRQGECGVELR